MQITLNGKPTEMVGEELSVTEFIAGLDLGKHPVLVELNGAAILVREFEETLVRDGDQIEVIRMVAGG